MRDIDAFEIEEAVIAGVVIEDYPEDKYSPSCLILGRTQNGRILHVQVCYPPKVKVITVTHHPMNGKAIGRRENQDE